MAADSGPESGIDDAVQASTVADPGQDRGLGDSGPGASSSLKPTGGGSVAGGPTGVRSPATEAPADRQLAAAVLVAGLIGAAALPVAGVGIGWAVAALAAVGVAAMARSRSLATPTSEAAAPARPGDRLWPAAAGVASLLLVAVPAVRSAGWLVALCLTASVLLASYALTGGRSALELIRGGFAVIPAAVRGMGWASSAAERENSRGGPERQRWVGRVAAGLACGLVLLVLFGALFSAADPAFADLIARWREDISVWTLVRGGIGFAAVATAALGAVHLVWDRQRPEMPLLRGTGSRSGLAEWVIPLAMLDALFGIFVWVQVTVLFGGDDYVLAEGGPDYAVYARGGSVQLGVVAVLTLGVVAAVRQWVDPNSPLRRGLLRILGGILCGLTLVVVASGLTRLSLYADAYGFTVPRLLVYAGEVWLGLVFVLLLFAGVRLRATWLPRAVTASAVAVLIALAAVNPEARMARTHMDRLAHNYGLDLYFLSNLSADAVDEIDRLPEPDRSCLLATLAADLANPEPWYRWNAARAHARQVIATRPYTKDCTYFIKPSGESGPIPTPAVTAGP